ncbi:MAG: glutamine--fructose-6-phosphate transaminase (isomerizing) [Clostridia bacterium]
MCGIVGYIGSKNAVPILIDGLEKLEYRGYDSAGIAVYNDNAVFVEKSKGRLKNLEEKIADHNLFGTIGIGHTRWATHGEPSYLNAHPHVNLDSSIAVIHNGIIENYLEIKDFLLTECGIAMKSETDTEVIAHLIGYYYKGDLLDAVYKAVDRMEGAYAIGVIANDEPNRLIAVRKDSPLIVGLGDGENFIASDIPAILKHTKDVLFIENNEFVEITRESVQIYDSLKRKVTREPFLVTWDLESAEKEGYEHFTLKEIHEQPKAVANTISSNLKDGLVAPINMTITKENLENINQIYIVACGTAYHAGLIGKYALKRFAGIKVDCDIASEFRYNDPVIDDKTLLIVVSQSGETLDTLQSMRMAKEKGARILSVVNVVGSSITRESDDIFYTVAGPEIGVASTKVFTAQLAAFYLIALHFAKLKGKMTDEQIREVTAKLIEIPEKMEQVLSRESEIQKIASSQFNNESVFFMGRNLDMDIAYESSLKLKEISYINSFAIAAGELKHGTIALIEKGTLVVSIATQDKLFDKMLSNIKEVKSRGAYIFSVAKEGHQTIEGQSDEVFFIPHTDDILTPFLSVIPMQLFAYNVSLMRGNDVDKPRNLAKSVTVE